MRLPTAPPRRRAATAAVEFALISPLLVTLLLGLWELGRAIQVFQIVSNAAREGARQAASAKYTKAEVQQSVFDYLVNANVPMSDTLPQSSVDLSNTNATITVANVTSGGEVFDANQLDKMTVYVSVPVKNFRWISSTFYMPANGKVSATVGFLCTRDIPINIVSTIPQSPLPGP